MGLKALSMGEICRTRFQDSVYLVVDENARDRYVAASKSVADDLDVRDHAFLLPGVRGTRSAHTTHEFVQDKERAVSFAHFFDGSEIPFCRRNAAG